MSLCPSLAWGGCGGREFPRTRHDTHPGLTSSTLAGLSCGRQGRWSQGTKIYCGKSSAGVGRGASHCSAGQPRRLSLRGVIFVSEFRILLRVPAAYFYNGLRRSQFTGTVGGCDFALLAGEKRDVVVLPDDRQNLFAMCPFVDLQPHEECQTLGWVFEDHVGDGFFALT